jgi:hypothetical protein
MIDDAKASAAGGPVATDLEALPVPSRERSARRALAVATLVTAVGLAVAGTVDRALGGVITVAGWLVLVFALHALGRAAAPS